MVTAQVISYPADTSATPVAIPYTSPGIGDSPIRVPSWPAALAPQHFRPPAVVTAQVSSFVKGRSALALFRGAPGYFRTEVAHEFVRQDTRPTLAFFDFDPKGLSMAASLPRREALCLPPMESLEAAVKAKRRRDLYFNSAEVARPHLESLPSNSEIAIAWSVMNSLEMGLDQEHFLKN